MEHTYIHDMYAADPLANAYHFGTHKGTPDGHLYFRQNRTLEVIQLIEVPAPPPAQHPSTITSSSDASSSSSFASSEDSESVGSSYCSSDPEELGVDAPRTGAADDTYGTRLRRVLVWRESSAKYSGAAQGDTLRPPPLLKRPAEQADDDDDDAASHTSKRSRTAAGRERTHRRLSAHSCPACDASFSSRQKLRQHGSATALNDACRIAVAYDLES